MKTKTAMKVIGAINVLSLVGTLFSIRVLLGFGPNEEFEGLARTLFWFVYDISVSVLAFMGFLIATFAVPIEDRGKVITFSLVGFIPILLLALIIFAGG